MTERSRSTIHVERTQYAGGIPNRWLVQRDCPPHSTYHDDVEDALLMVRVMMRATLEDE